MTIRREVESVLQVHGYVSACAVEDIMGIIKGETPRMTERVEEIRRPQPRCPTCGRFAYWHEVLQGWRFHCVFTTDEGWSEHD